MDIKMLTVRSTDSIRDIIYYRLRLDALYTAVFGIDDVNDGTTQSMNYFDRSKSFYT